MRCYYHGADLDGKCSAAIVKRKYPECEFAGVDYPDRPNFREIAPGEKVFVLDYSFEPKDMLKLTTICGSNNVIWIDHHKSAIRELEGLNLPGLREIGAAGCELTWRFLFPDARTPLSVSLLGRYDVFDYADENVVPFQYGMKGHSDWRPDDHQWRLLFDDDQTMISRMLRNGEIIMRYEKLKNAAYAETMAFPVEFEGYRAWAVNGAFMNSAIFETLGNDQERPLWILFSYRDGLWIYKIYSAGNAIDVSEIAVRYGGGGHAGAAGFRSEKYLLIDMKEEWLRVDDETTRSAKF